MESHKTKASARDFFINLGAIVALYVTVVSLLNLLFTVINNAYPQIVNGYNYAYSSSISFPVATLIIFFPIYVFLMVILEKGYKTEPEKKQLGIRKWLTYITLFIAGLTLAGDLVSVIYFFIDGQELTTGFLLKALSVLVVVMWVFWYYLSDIQDKLTQKKRKMLGAILGIIIVSSIAWGFAVLGSPRTQQLIKYDQQKVNDLQILNSEVQSYYQMKGSLPLTIAELSAVQYSDTRTDMQSGKPYEYNLIGQSAKAYELCAEFNKASDEARAETSIAMYPYAPTSWTHPAGRYCFQLAIPANQTLPTKSAL